MRYDHPSELAPTLAVPSSDAVSTPVCPPPLEPHPAHRLLADLENEIERFLGRRTGRIPALIASIRQSLP